MPIKEILTLLVKYVPAHVMRLVVGSVILGLALMLFLKVVDDRLKLPESALLWVGVGVAVLFAMFLCLYAKAILEKCLHFAVGFVMIFSVGLASNNVIADIRGNLAPSPVADLNSILGSQG